MKKKFIALFLATAVIASGCGKENEPEEDVEISESEISESEDNEDSSEESDRSSLEDSIEGEDATEASENESSESAFGAQVASEYPISSEIQAKLDAVSYDYAKINWLVTYVGRIHK